MMQWISENKDWLFSGILTSVIFSCVGFIAGRRYERQIVQKAKAKNNSTIIQSGGNYKNR